MWAGVASDLAELFGSGIYKALLEEPDYQLFLGRAGLKKPFPRDMRFLSKKQQEDLQSAAQMHAGLLIADLQKGESLRERRAKAQTVEGPVTLYRSWNGAYPKSKFGFWWFSEGLMREAQAQAGPLPAKQMEWLRDRLAVSYDWSDCDRIAVMKLNPGDVLPAVQAWGLPMRVYSLNIRGGVWTNTAPTQKDYWDNLARTFQGQKTQLYLPWVPSRRVGDLY